MAPRPTTLLILSDDRVLLAALAGRLRRAGHLVETTEDPTDALARLGTGRTQVLLVDLDTSGLHAAEFARDLQHRAPHVVTVALTGFAPAGCPGSFECLTKPVVDDDVLAAVDRAARRQALAGADDGTAPAGVVGRDPQMLRVFELVDAVADSRTTVLITGESGTGKSVLARAIHARSPRRDKPFVEVSCGALTETLLESELFGHVRGAFTGATGDKPGRFLAADGGTLFLDEINSATPALQVKLLRALQERAFEPVGSTVTRAVDVRVVLASNVDLALLVADGRFRQDLYYRVNVVTIRLPPLRERPGDVPLLADGFIRRFRAEGNRPAVGLTPAAAAALGRYAWPGNVRELENAMERAVVLCRRPYIDVDDLPETVRASPGPVAVTVPVADALTFEAPLPLSVALELPERRIIESALKRNHWNRQQTADELGINRTTLYKKMLKHRLDTLAR
jgi:two-component system response regulator AtoC